MNTTLKLLSAVTITVLLVSCGGNDKTNDAPKLENTLVKDNKITDILKKKSVIYGKAESFEFHFREEEEVDKFNITMIVMSADNMDCTADAMLCEEISSFIGGNKLVFSSSEEYALIEEESPEYRMMQKGTIEINDNTYSGTLYYNGKGNNEVVSFHGKLIFELPAVKLLKRESLIIEIKGKK